MNDKNEPDWAEVEAVGLSADDIGSDVDQAGACYYYVDLNVAIAALRAANVRARAKTLEAIAVQFETNGYVDACASDTAMGQLYESNWKRAATSIRALAPAAEEKADA